MPNGLLEPSLDTRLIGDINLLQFDIAALEAVVDDISPDGSMLARTPALKPAHGAIGPE